MSMINNIQRVGNFTSSECYKLLSRDKLGKCFGKPALSYIQEKNMERILGRSLSTGTDARPLQWGRLMESLVFEQLALSYSLTSQETITHPNYDFWSGSDDGTNEDTVFDIKNPITLKSFFLLTQGENIYSMRDGFSKDGAEFPHHPDGDKYYLQLVSNSILRNKKYAELIVFVPRKEQLEDIRNEAKFQGINWIAYSSDDELPYLQGLENLVKMRFEVPQKDKDELTAAMIEASKLLIPRNIINSKAATA